MLDEYTRQRFDRIADDVAVTRAKVELIEHSLSGVREQFEAQDERLGRVERRVFAMWVLGPIAVGAAAFLNSEVSRSEP